MLDYTRIVMILDRSGSMETMKSTMESAIANFIKEQKESVGEANFTLVHFDNYIEKILDRVPMNAVPNISIYPRGSTALYDALAQTIDEVGQELSSLNEKDRPNKVVFVVITDGFENASKKYNKQQVLDRINHQSKVYNWQFVYLGANQDSLANGSSLGFDTSSCSNYNQENVFAVMRNVSHSLSAYRAGTKDALSL